MACALELSIQRFVRAGNQDLGHLEVQVAQDVRELLCHADGNAYVCGGFASTANFSSETITSLAGLDVFLAKYNSVGNALWARRAGTLATTTAP